MEELLYIRENEVHVVYFNTDTKEYEYHPKN